TLAVEVSDAQHILMVNIGELGDELRRSGRIHEMSGGDPLRVGNICSCGRGLVAVHRSAKLQTTRKQRPREDVEGPCAIVVDVAGISATADWVSASVADSDAVIQAHRSRRNAAFRQRADEVHGNQASAKLDHVWTADRSLQPCAVMELSVPIVDRSVITAERQ